MSDQVYLTPEGAEEVRLELARLKSTDREELSKRLRDAIQMGDLSENADYHKAKEDQGFLEGRIQELEYMLQHAVLIDRQAAGRDSVQVGATVTVQETGEQPEVYFLVGAKEADPRKGRISNESPVGRALLGTRVGDMVVVQTPAGQTNFKVLKIE